MRFAVIGAKGQVGQEFTKLVGADRMIPLGTEDLDVVDRASVESCLKELSFDVLINLAAFHNVNGCEDEPVRAFAVNATGAFHVASVCAQMDKGVVFFSSDYVFGGESSRATPYLESDAAAPLNVYGASKVAGEQLVRAVLPENHLIVRSSSLYGCVTSKKGWTFPELMLNKARAGEDLRVVNDQIMVPTYTHDLVQRVLELVGKGASGTYHVANTGFCSWYEFALATFELVGVGASIRPVPSGEFPAKARRPAYSVLATCTAGKTSLPELRHWREALRAYLVEKGDLK